MTSESSDKKTWENETAKNIADFDKLLDAISGASAREKMLWREIYDNAISDRQAANLCFLALYPDLKRDVDKHMMGGDKLSKYLNNLTKSNDQLLKLADLIQKAITDDEETINDEALYAEMLKADQEGTH